MNALGLIIWLVLLAATVFAVRSTIKLFKQGFKDSENVQIKRVKNETQQQK